MMQIVPYDPERFPDLCVAVEKMQRGYAMATAEFVDHYYFNNPWCQLQLVVAEDDQSIIGTVGYESIPFLLNGETTSIGFGTNYHTLEKGCGVPLFMKWVRNQAHSMVYNCSEDTNKLTTAQRWNRLDGIQSLSYNAPAHRNPNHSDFTHFLKSTIKGLLRKPPLDKALEKCDSLKNIDVSVTEEDEFQSWMLDFESAFDFRIAPDLEYLRWRFSTDWQLFKYRVFSIKQADEYRGFVVLHDSPDQVYVAHADATSPLELVKGELLALAQVSGNRPSFLNSSLPAVTEQLQDIGFRIHSNAPCIQFSAKLPIDQIKRPALNFALGDNDLRTDLMHKSASSTN